RPRTGTMRFQGRDLRGLRPHEIARLGIARVFQTVELFPHMTVADNLMLGRHVLMRTGLITGALWLGPARREEVRHRRRVEEVIDFLEMQAIRASPVGALPYGLQKRVQLGRALAMEPKLLLLDEPVAGKHHVALREKRLGIWREHTWADYYDRARAVGLGLVALGLGRGDRVAIHSEDRPEWLFTEIGAICVGATSLGIYPTSPPTEVEYLLAHSGARYLVAEDQEQVDKALSVADRCPRLERIVYVDQKGLRGYRDARLLAFAEVERLG